MWPTLLFGLRNPGSHRHRTRSPLGRPPGRRLVEYLEDRTVPSGGLVGNLVIFGDSLSDTGNAALATGGILPNPDLYYQGRFSNGPIWVDTLAKYLGEPAVQPSLVGGLDYAYGGATVAYETPLPPYNTFPRVSQQVGDYLAGHTPAANDLMVVWAGANDFGQSFFTPAGPFSPILSADTLASSLEMLANAGARQFVVPNLFPIGATPWIRGFGVSEVANQWTAAFNAELAADVATFVATFPSHHNGETVTVVSVDVAGLFQEALQPDNPFGFVNTTDPVGPLLSPYPYLASINVADPQDYLFFDGIHPTSKAHQLIGLEAAAAVYDALDVHHLVVTSTADTVDPTASGLSLREMVNLSNAMAGQQTLTFDLGRGRHQIGLGGEELSITDDLTIEGSGANKLTVSGNDASRVFNIGPDADVAISGLTITHGLAVNGGGILNDGGTLTLSHDVISDNEALGASGAPGQTASGGGIANVNGATLTLKFSTVSNNQAVGGNATGTGNANGGNGLGGGLYNGPGSTMIVTAGLIIHNQAIGGNATGTGRGGSGLGGGIDNVGDSTRAASLTVSYSALIGNQAQGGDGLTGFSGRTGGTAMSGGINSIVPNGSASELTVSYSTFTGNQARGGAGGGLAYGGAIRNGFTDLSVIGSIFTGNLAQGGDGGVGTLEIGAAYGGGISSVFSNVTAGVVGSSIFMDNQAVGGNGNTGGGGSLTLVGVAAGGAIIQGSGNLTVSDSAFTGNEAVGGDRNTGGSATSNLVGYASGGAILLTFTAGLPAGTVTVNNSTFFHNQAVGGAGTLPGTAGTSFLGGAAGGAIGNVFGGNLDVRNSAFAFNQAVGGAGAAGHDGGEGVGGGIAVQFDHLLPNTGGSLSMSNVTLAYNQAVGGVGGVGGNGGNGQGGGLFNDSNEAVISGTSFVLNLALGGAGGTGGDGGDGQGGGFYNAGTATLTESIIAFNKAKGGAAGGSGGIAGTGIGGGIYNDIDVGATISIDALTVIFGNEADEFDDCFGCPP